MPWSLRDSVFYNREQKNIIEMIFPGSLRHHELLESYAGFFEGQILPGAKKIDEGEIFPKENLGNLVEKGFFALPFAGEYGGGEIPFPVYVAGVEMLAKACANTVLPLSIQGMVCEGILHFGSDEQKRRFLSEYGFVTGRNLIAFALTEPCCGSDAGAIRTEAVPSGDAYLLSGSKMLISNPGETAFALVFAATGRGVSCFVVPSDTPGVTVMQTIPKLGFRGNGLAAIRFENCRVPVENRLGEEGKGLEYAKHMLNHGRITIAAIGVGIAQAAFEKSLHYSRRREAFGKSISNFQLVQEKLADMATEISAARLLTYRAASLKYKGEDIAMGASQAKLFASEMAQRVCDQAIQIHGGYGYTDAYDIHRHWRDARMLTLGEGTSDMLRLLIAHLALKEI